MKYHFILQNLTEFWAAGNSVWIRHWYVYISSSWNPPTCYHVLSYSLFLFQNSTNLPCCIINPSPLLHSFTTSALRFLADTLLIYTYVINYSHYYNYDISILICPFPIVIFLPIFQKTHRYCQIHYFKCHTFSFQFQQHDCQFHHFHCT